LNKNNKSYENWKKVWDNRDITIDDNKSLLNQLIAANGFDTGVGDYSLKDWNNLTRYVSKRLKLDKNSNLFEIGCGSGAFLYSLNIISGCKIYGIDYSQSLIKIANKYLKGAFKNLEASDDWALSTEMDYIVSHSVFNYFPNNAYLIKTLNNAYKNLKIGGKIIALDLNDVEKQVSYHHERKKLYVDSEQYEEKYKNHQHLFFAKDQIIVMLEKAGFSNIQFFDNPCKNYKNSQFRFNFQATKI